MIFKYFRRLKKITLKIYGRFRYRSSPKIFVVGRNKTGTTSMAAIFQQLGIPVGNQREAEQLLRAWQAGQFSAIEEYVRRSGVAFQDIPFSLPGTFEAMDKAFPDAKFILTIRDSAEVWYDSLTRFHSKLFGNGKLPNREDLENASYVWKGWVWEVNRALYKTPEDTPYQRKALLANYEAYNQSVIEYFSGRPEKLLVVNLKDEDAANRISSFLPYNVKIDRIPWENQSRRIRARQTP